MGITVGILIVLTIGVGLVLRSKRDKQENGSATSGGDATSTKDTASGEKAKARVSREKPNAKVASAPSPTHQMDKNLIFIGRKAALTDLVSKQSKEGPTLLCIHGESGMGRTVLAIHLTNKLSSRYPDAQFYIDLKADSKQPVTTADAMAQVIWAYRPTAKLPVNPDELASLYSTVLRDKKAILLLDNADDAKVKSLIPPRTCLLLAIAREPMAIPTMFNRKIGIFPSDESNAIMGEFAPEAEDFFGQLVTLCDNLPLGITIVGRCLAKASKSEAKAFLETFKTEKEKARQAKGQTGAVGFSTVLTLASRRLSDKTVKVWHELLVFPGTFSGKAVEFICDDTKRNHLDQLVAFGLVGCNVSSDRYFLHELIRDHFGKTVNRFDIQGAQSRHASYYLKVINTAADYYRQGGEGIKHGLNLIDMEWGNIQQGFTWAEQAFSKDSAAAKVCSSYVETGYDLFQYRLRPSVRIKWLESALSACMIVKDQEAEKNHLLNLGLDYQGQKDFPQAINYFNRTLELARLLTNRVDEGVALRHLGMVHAAMGNVAMAIEFYQQELDLARARGDKTDEGRVLASMGEVFKKSGDFSKATWFFQLRLKLAQGIDDTLMEGQSLKSLADTLFETESEMAPVLDMYERAIDIFKTLKNSHEEGLALRGKGFVHLKMKLYPSAVEFLQKAQGILNRARDYRNEAVALNGLAMIHAAENRLPQAIEMYLKVAVIFQKFMDRRNHATTLENLGKAYKDSVEMELAIKTYERALELAKEISDRPMWGRVLWELCQLYELTGDRLKAIRHADAALKILEVQNPVVAEVKKKLEFWKEQ